MPEGKWVVVTTCYEAEADVIAALLESSGIEVRLINDEIYGPLGGFTVGPMAEVKVVVQAQDEQQAKEILAADIQDDNQSKQDNRLTEDDSSEASGGDPVPQITADIIAALLDSHIASAISGHYGVGLPYQPGGKIIKMAPANEGRSFPAELIIEIKPYVGQNIAIGVDHISFAISPGMTQVTRFEHIQDCEVPESLRGDWYRGQQRRE